MKIEIFFYAYAFVGLLFMIFNKKLGDLNYKLVLYYTDKLHLKDFFIFKIDHNNVDSMIFLTRSFAALFGLSIIVI